VSSNNDTLKKRVEAVLDMALTTVSSLSESFVSGAPVVAEEIGLAKENPAIPLAKVDQEGNSTESPMEATEEVKVHS
jgi:cleavage and polyadenylation specificity factor subunit 3